MQLELPTDARNKSDKLSEPRFGNAVVEFSGGYFSQYKQKNHNAPSGKRRVTLMNNWQITHIIVVTVVTAGQMKTTLNCL